MFPGYGVLVSVLVLCVASWTGEVAAQEKGPSCQEQLLVKTTHDQLVVQKRAEVEDQLALVAAQAQVLERKVQILTKENTELKSKLATPAEPEKPKE